LPRRDPAPRPPTGEASSADPAAGIAAGQAEPIFEGSGAVSVREPFAQKSMVVQVLRGEHPAAVRVTVAAIVVDVLLLVVILALSSFPDRPAASLNPATAHLALAGLLGAG
jgi:hypothetical protein